MIRRLWLRFTAPMDSFLLTSLALLMLVGLFTIYSGSSQNLDKVLSHAESMLIALAIMWVFANMPPQHIMRAALPLYVFGLLLLLAVALFGEVSHGARRWLHIGVTRIQPSEMMKIAVPLMLAWYFDKHEATLRLKNYAVAALLLLVPIVLIVRQPDLGTALLISASGFYVLFLAGLSWRIMLGLLLGFAAGMPVLWSLLHDYQRQRILTLLDPAQDPLGAGYHIIQSTIAVGSGGFFGKGWLHGTQTHLDFLPESSTDFIFAVFAEEFGLLGSLFLLGLFSVIVGRGLIITGRASTLFCRLLAGSLTLTFSTYAFVNMGMVSGILPVVGVPLPLVSYGGTSLVTLLLGFGMLMSIYANRKLVKT